MREDLSSLVHVKRKIMKNPTWKNTLYYDGNILWASVNAAVEAAVGVGLEFVLWQDGLIYTYEKKMKKENYVGLITVPTTFTAKDIDLSL